MQKQFDFCNHCRHDPTIEILDNQIKKYKEENKDLKLPLFRRIDYIFAKLNYKCANLIITDNENYAVILSIQENLQPKLIEKTDKLHLDFLLSTAKDLNRLIVVDMEFTKSIYDSFDIYEIINISNEQLFIKLNLKIEEVF